MLLLMPVTRYIPSSNRHSNFEAIEPADGCLADLRHSFEHFVPPDAFIVANRYLYGLMSPKFPLQTNTFIRSQQIFSRYTPAFCQRIVVIPSK
jgi:hypothetical protein